MNLDAILRKLKIPKSVADYFIPAAIAVFLVYQFVVPAVSKTLDSKRGLASIQQSSKAAVEVKKVAVKPKVVPSGKYFSFKANYTCLDEKKGKRIPSFVDYFTVSDSQVCQMGDSCNKKEPNCKPRLPSGAGVSADSASFTFEKRKYVRQADAIAETCVVPDCAMPPEPCQFDELPSLDEKGCPAGCGTITCKAMQAECPALNCAALPQGCEYDGMAPKDGNGCFTGCGNISCDSIVQTDLLNCQQLNCPKPPENCRYDNSGKFDKKGCKTSCGQIVCDRIDPKDELCPKRPSCAAPPEGCYYVGEPAIDQDGCRIGCGGIACVKNIPDKCAPTRCDPLPDNCRYDGNAPLDFNGCMSNCGNVICK